MRIWIALGAAIMLVAAGTTYTLHRRTPSVSVAISAESVDLTTPGRLWFRTEAPGPDQGKVASVPLDDPAGPRWVSPLRCARFHTSGGAGLCLTDAPGPLPSAVAEVVGPALTVRSRVDVAGIPNRARLSASGRMAAWTTFVTGDSYAAAGTFSTRTAIMDTGDGQLSSNLEGIALRGHHSEDLNYWGVTFAGDDRTFYATVATAGRTHLVRGDNTTWTAETLRENAECPSLSPDGTRIAFKKRVDGDGARPWRPYVLDLATMTETPLAETRGIDDQMVWLGNHTIAYALPTDARTDVWTVPADGSGTPRLLVPYASSPSLS